MNTNLDTEHLPTAHLYATPHSQDEQLRLELIKRLASQSYIFASDPKDAFIKAKQTNGTPTDKLFAYADILDSDHALHDTLKRANRTLPTVGVAWAIVSLILSFIATYGLMSGQIINFFYILIALLGWHSISLLLWLIRPKSDTLFSIFGQLFDKIAPSRHQNDQDLSTTQSHKNPLKDTARQVIDTANLPIRHWQLAKIIHQGWLGNLIGCLLALFLLFLSKSYLFVWESTLLTQAHIAKLIYAVGVPMNLVGISTPSLEVLMSGNLAPKALAILLLNSVLFYGILPRLLVWAVVAFLIQKHRYQVDLKDYFFENLLRQFNQTITNPNDYTPPAPRPVKQGIQFGKHLIATLELPANDKDWYKALAPDAMVFGNLETKDNFERFKTQLENTPMPVLLGINGQLLPDRSLVKRLQWVATHAKQGLVVHFLNDGEHKGAWQTVLAENGIGEVA